MRSWLLEKILDHGRTLSLTKWLQFEGGGLRQYEVAILKSLIAEWSVFGDGRDQTQKLNLSLSKSASGSLCFVCCPRSSPR
jgi:hypothetical protein